MLPRYWVPTQGESHFIERYLTFLAPWDYSHLWMGNISAKQAGYEGII
jgi:hypothetical protein